MRSSYALALVATFLAGCGSSPSTPMDGAYDDAPLPKTDGGRDAASLPTFGDAGSSPAADAGPPPKASGTFHALTYNVAGLPESLSGSHPTTNIPLISPKLNPFELVFAQEDFAYHSQLISQATHAYKTSHKSATLSVGDGVSILSRAALGADKHVAWNDCNGYLSDKNDCLTKKGFVVTTMTLAPGFTVDVYDLHADAGRSSGDAKARQKQMNQLAAYITANSVGKAVLVAGDTNMKQEDEAELTSLMTGANLTDACRKLSCAEPYRIDRILYRDGGGVVFTPTKWTVDMTFVDGNNAQLSDHEPIAVDFAWSAP